MDNRYVSIDKEKSSNYYNSDLSEFIGKQCERTMTSIDVDILQIKKSKKLIRFIESKHSKEKLGYQQEQALKLISQIGKIINNNPKLFNNHKVEVYLVRGNPPYNLIEIYDFINNENFLLQTQLKIKSFLQCDYDLNDNDKPLNLFL